MKKNSELTYLSPSECSCPICGSRNIQGITRITGYLSLDERFGEGKVNERSHRVAHNSKEHKKIYDRA